MRLATANVLVFGAGPTATETLKNLVLPGLGRFTIVDGATVGSTDLGNNFFVTEDSVGAPRAEVVCDLLVEMNPDDCVGTARVADPATLVATEPAFIADFSLVIATMMAPATLAALGKMCWERGIPLVVVRSHGFLGYLRLQLRDHEVVETKPDTTHWDLRIDQPFPALTALVASYDLDSMDFKDHMHTPYVVLLLKALEAWKRKRGAAPANFKENTELKALLKSMERLPAASPNQGQDQSQSGGGGGVSGGTNREANFEEGYKNFHRWKPRALSENVESILASVRSGAKPLAGGGGGGGGRGAVASDFLFLVHALVEFMDNEGGGKPPLTGSLPDMEADNPKYIALQRCYESKASEDVGSVAARVATLLEANGRPRDAISLEAVQVFCKNAWDLKAVTTRTLEQESSSPVLDPGAVFDAADESLWPQCPLLWHIALKGTDQFQMATGRYPGSNPEADEASLASDAEKVWSEMNALLRKASPSEGGEGGGGVEFSQLNESYAAEVCRFGCSFEVHNVAAFMGGAAAQECVKVITKQWAPANNTFIYNGIAGTAATYEF